MQGRAFNTSRKTCDVRLKIQIKNSNKDLVSKYKILYQNTQECTEYLKKRLYVFFS